MCCDLLDKMQNTNTESIDIGISIFSDVIFDVIYISNSFYHPTLPQSVCHFEYKVASSEVYVGTCKLTSINWQ
jgi:hypothetical protein